MTASGHIAVTGVTTQYLDNPIQLVTVNLALHLLLQMIPHAEWTTFVRRSKMKAIAITAVDFAVGGWYVWQLFIWLDKPTWFILTGLLAGFWLDILLVVMGWCWPGIKRLQVRTHSWPQPPTEPIDWSQTVTGQTPVWVKLIIQTLLVIVPYWFLRQSKKKPPRR